MRGCSRSQPEAICAQSVKVIRAAANAIWPGISGKASRKARYRPVTAWSPGRLRSRATVPCQRLDILACDVGQEFLMARRFGIQDQAGFAASILATEDTRADAQPQFEGHVEPRQLVLRIGFRSTDVMHAQRALLRDADGLADTGLGAIIDLRRATRPAPAIGGGEDQGMKDGPAVRVEAAVEDDADRFAPGSEAMIRRLGFARTDAAPPFLMGTDMARRDRECTRNAPDQLCNISLYS